MTKYISKDGQVEITQRPSGKGRVAWSCHVKGSHKGTKVLYTSNASVVENFGYVAQDFNKVEE